MTSTIDSNTKQIETDCFIAQQDLPTMARIPYSMGIIDSLHRNTTVYITCITWAPCVLHPSEIHL